MPKQKGKTIPLPPRKFDNKPLVRIRNLKTFYPIRKGVFLRVANHIRAVDHINLDIPKGATLALVGNPVAEKPLWANPSCNWFPMHKEKYFLTIKIS